MLCNVFFIYKQTLDNASIIINVNIKVSFMKKSPGHWVLVSLCDIGRDCPTVQAQTTHEKKLAKIIISCSCEYGLSYSMQQWHDLRLRTQKHQQITESLLQALQSMQTCIRALLCAANRWSKVHLNVEEFVERLVSECYSCGEYTRWKDSI